MISTYTYLVIINLYNIQMMQLLLRWFSNDEILKILVPGEMNSHADSLKFDALLGIRYVIIHSIFMYYICLLLTEI